MIVASLFTIPLNTEVMDCDEKSCPDPNIALGEPRPHEVLTVDHHLRVVVLIASQKRDTALVPSLLMCALGMTKTTRQVGHGWIVQGPRHPLIHLVIVSENL
jgi:hypothetical protein